MSGEERAAQGAGEGRARARSGVRPSATAGMSGEERAAQGAGEGGSRPPVALTIAGSDPSGGAGIQADLKSFSALGAYGCAVLTALTAQSTQGVTGVHPVPPEFVREQVATLVDDVRLDAAKIGMLASAPIVEVETAAVDDLLD